MISRWSRVHIISHRALVRVLDEHYSGKIDHWSSHFGPSGYIGRT
jgi:hypothetical protein